MGRFRMDRSGVRLWRRLIIERAQPSESFSQPALNTSVRWLIPTRPRHALGKIGLPSGIAIGLIMGVAVAFVIPHLLHKFSRRIAKMEGTVA